MADDAEGLFISIHSLVKRETKRSAQTKRDRIYFNPLPRKEGDRIYGKRIDFHGYFNPLPRKEGDDGYYCDVYKYLKFQSTPS